MNLTLTLLPTRYGICRLRPDERIPDWANAGCFISITRTDDELSIVCAESNVPAGVKSDLGWRCFKVAGPLDLSLTGVLAALAGPLAEAQINIFAVSTFDTDYLLVREENLIRAAEVLTRSAHQINNL